MVVMTEKPKFKGTIIVCVRCKREIKHFAKGKCRNCYNTEAAYQRYLKAPLKKCECRPECQVMIKTIDKKGTRRKYAVGHTGIFNSGKNNGMWKGGFQELPKKYRYQLFRDHPFCNIDGYIMFHRIVYEMYHKCCLLPWADVHHIDGNKRRNHPENLQGMMKGDHSSLTQKERKKKIQISI